MSDRDAEFRRNLPPINLGQGKFRHSNVDDLIKDDHRALRGQVFRESRNPVAEMADWDEAHEYRYGS